MTNHETDRSVRTRHIAMRGVGLDPDGVYRFAGETGSGIPGTVELTGEALEAYERNEAEVINETFDGLVETGMSEAKARESLNLD